MACFFEDDVRDTIDKFASFVARKGVEFEQVTKNSQQGNPKFAFLFGGEFHHYYRLQTSSLMLRFTS